MTTRLTVIIAAVAGICCAVPAGAEEVGPRVLELNDWSMD
jgi:hypothetical protein